MLIHALVAKI